MIHTNFDDNDHDVSLKIILLGDSSVGKTSISHRWSIGYFDPKEKPTIGAFSSLHVAKINKNYRISREMRNFYSENIVTFPTSDKSIKDEQREVDVFLWDTAGQEQYSSLTPFFLRDAVAVILVVSCVDRHSFENIDRWTSLIRQFTAKTPPVILAINKIDMLSSPTSIFGHTSRHHVSNSDITISSFTVNDIINVFLNSDEEITDHIAGILANIVPVSAKSGLNVDALFEIAVENGYDFYMKNSKMATRPTTFLKLDQQPVDHNNQSTCC